VGGGGGVLGGGGVCVGGVGGNGPPPPPPPPGRFLLLFLGKYDSTLKREHKLEHDNDDTGIGAAGSGKIWVLLLALPSIGPSFRIYFGLPPF